MDSNSSSSAYQVVTLASYLSSLGLNFVILKNEYNGFLVKMAEQVNAVLASSCDQIKTKLQNIGNIVNNTVITWYGVRWLLVNTSLGI